VWCGVDSAGHAAKATVQEQELVARDQESAVFRDKRTPATTQAEDDPIPGNLKLIYFYFLFLSTHLVYYKKKQE